MKIKRFNESKNSIIVYFDMNAEYGRSDFINIPSKEVLQLTDSDKKLINNIFSDVILEFNYVNYSHSLYNKSYIFGPQKYKRLTIKKLSDEWWIVSIRQERSEYAMDFPFICDSEEGLKLLSKIMKGEVKWGDVGTGGELTKNIFNT